MNERSLHRARVLERATFDALWLKLSSFGQDEIRLMNRDQQRQEFEQPIDRNTDQHHTAMTIRTPA
jgi:hypothetical protein